MLFVHGIVFSHYSIQDRSAEAYAMVQLFESGYADQNDIARCFGYSARTLRRYQERLKVGGLSALARPRGRPVVRSPVNKKLHERDRAILRLKAKEMSNRWIASRWDLRAIVVAHRMFERWRQENFFKYLREEYLLDALADYQVEPDDPTRSIPNLARKAAVKEVYAARVYLRKLRESYGATAIDYINRRTSTDSGFAIAEEKIRMEIDKAMKRIKKLQARRDSLPARVTVADVQKGQEMVKLSTERKHLTNVLKMVAYQTESDLVELIRPHYSRVEDEGRTFIQLALQDTADIEPTDDQLRIRLAPLSSPHRSRVLESLCNALNKTNTLFPGTQLQMFYVVAPLS